MLPVIQKYATAAFRHLKAEARQEAVQDVTANALVAYVRLVELGKADVAFPTVLARYGVLQFCGGRRVGTRLNVLDVSSDYCQRRKGFLTQRLDRFDHQEGTWCEAVVEDHRTPVADQAAFRIDFPDWLSRHSGRNRQIAMELAVGHSTSTIARKYGLSHGRISQLRREFAGSWQKYHDGCVPGEKDADASARGQPDD